MWGTARWGTSAFANGRCVVVRATFVADRSHLYSAIAIGSALDSRLRRTTCRAIVARGLRRETLAQRQASEDLVDIFEVMQDPWDCLIVLDACRYDYFAEVWTEFLPAGELTKVHSAGSSTVEWRDNSFPSYYDDIVYVSANPYINSVRAVEGFLAREHFQRVEDVWSDGWDAAKGTVLPQSVTEAALRVVRGDSPRRLIVHYLQPHSPYLPMDPDATMRETAAK